MNYRSEIYTYSPICQGLLNTHRLISYSIRLSACHVVTMGDTLLLTYHSVITLVKFVVIRYILDL